MLTILALAGKALFWMVFATVVACIEIESEGKWGWAEKAPTWFRTTGFVAWLYGVIMGKKPLTGYHSFMFFFPVLLFHVPFAGGVEWSVAAELMAWAMYFSWCILWDYHWFVLNPAYAGRFSKKYIWWHAQSPWIFGLFPADYLVGVVVSILLAAGAARWSHSDRILTHHVAMLLLFGVYTLILKGVSPFYHAWYERMHDPVQDERHLAPIFHVCSTCEEQYGQEEHVCERAAA